MTYIAICDDDILLTGTLETMLFELQEPLRRRFHVDVYVSGRELVQALEQGSSYDIVFLDIEMEGMNGIQTGYSIRSQAANAGPEIIYISSHDQYHIELYPIRPIAFVPKPLTRSVVERAVTLALDELQRKAAVFYYQKHQTIMRVWKSDIYYFESMGKKIRMVTNSGVDEFRMSFAKLLFRLRGDQDYVVVHRSFIVNLNNVSTFTRDVIYFPDSGVFVPVSAKRAKAVKAALMHNIKRKELPSNLD